jgi:hypothetical protein
VALAWHAGQVTATTAAMSSGSDAPSSRWMPSTDTDPAGDVTPQVPHRTKPPSIGVASPAQPRSARSRVASVSDSAPRA